jgi:acyl-CoA thioesterase FadM
MRAQYQLGFVDVDYARIMFSGDVYRWVDHTFERWQQDLGLPWRRMIGELHLGLPSIETRCHYVSPVEFEDTFEVRVSARDLTSRGFVTDFELVVGEEERLASYGYLVRRFMNMQTLRAWPDPLEEAFAVFERMAEESDVIHYDERRRLLEEQRRDRAAAKEAAHGG